MTFSEGLQFAIELCTIAGFALGFANRWAVANHRDRLAMFTSGAANAAGRIRLALSDLPPGADLAATRARLTREAAEALIAEYDTTGPKISATLAKAESMIEGHISPPVPPVVP